MNRQSRFRAVLTQRIRTVLDEAFDEENLSLRETEISVDDLYVLEALIQAVDGRSLVKDGAICEYETWRILNEVYIASTSQKKICISDIGHVTGIPATTALRWLAVMQQRKLITRFPDPSDRRRIWLEITPHGRDCIEEWLSGVKKYFSSIISRASTKAA